MGWQLSFFPLELHSADISATGGPLGDGKVPPLFTFEYATDSSESASKYRLPLDLFFPFGLSEKDISATGGPLGDGKVPPLFIYLKKHASGAGRVPTPPPAPPQSALPYRALQRKLPDKDFLLNYAQRN